MAEEVFGACAARLSGLAGRLFGWRPDDFWKSTPAELAALAATDGEATGEPPPRSEISALMKRFPDS